MVLPAEDGRRRRPPAGPALKVWTARSLGIAASWFMFTVQGIFSSLTGVLIMKCFRNKRFILAAGPNLIRDDQLNHRDPRRL
jgi:hypothetical protein